MSPNLRPAGLRWSTVSSGFRENEIGWDRLESVGVLAPFLAPAHTSTPLTPWAEPALGPRAQHPGTAFKASSEVDACVGVALDPRGRESHAPVAVVDFRVAGDGNAPASDAGTPFDDDNPGGLPRDGPEHDEPEFRGVPQRLFRQF
jgi:hypothetical protein